MSDPLTVCDLYDSRTCEQRFCTGWGRRPVNKGVDVYFVFIDVPFVPRCVTVPD